MALRRLLSGWLIALAALARSAAQALERASEDRSAPAPDPVMAALAERYPGAPAHWLAHLAERTSQLAEVGEAPLSLNSDPSAWPPARPDGLASPPATQREAEPISRDPRRSAPGRDAAVPTLAALKDRSSEVWRRPDVERPRRPRPVFAAATPAPTPGRPTAASEPGLAPPRPRSPLTFVGSPSRAVSSTPEPIASEAPKAIPRETVWSEAPSPPAPFGETTARPDVQDATERPSIDRAFAQTRPRDVRKTPPERYSERNGTPSVTRRQRSWFFAKSTRAGRPPELSANPERHSGVERADAADAIAIDPSSAPRASIPFSTSDRATVRPERTWPPETPPTARRSIFRALAALRAKSRPRADQSQAPGLTVARPTPPGHRPWTEADPRRPASSFTPSRAEPSARGAPGFQAIDLEAPANPIEDHEISRVGERVARRSSIMPTASVETSVHDRRPIFTAPRPSRSRPVPSRPVSSRPVGPPSDDRWPALPPSTITSPPAFGAPPPRWDQLAREQEEGRWSV